MLRGAGFHRWLLTLVCVGLLSASVDGAHLHLCFDGSEPPASLHLEDAGHRDEHHASQAHNDLDVSLDSEAIIKSGKAAQDLLPAFAAIALVWLLPARSVQPLPRYVAPFVALTSHFLRPPLRGPPSLTSL